MVEPTAGKGLRMPAQVMEDKARKVSREKIDQAIGRLSDDDRVVVNHALALFLGFARFI